MKYAKEYIKLYDTMKIKKSKLNRVDKLVDKILSNKQRYKKVSNVLKCPWYLVAVIHNMESGQRFDRHLHNGDPLTARTKHYPPGRPKKGNPPFSWEESAIDALKLQRVHKVSKWDLPTLLYKIEEYNGWGYRKYHHINSPYLWSWSNHYKSGKYVADGKWSNSAVSAQCGAVVLLKRMEQRGEINITRNLTKKKLKHKRAKKINPLDILKA